MKIEGHEIGMLLRHVGRFAGVLGDDFAPLLHLLGRAMESLAQRKTLVVPMSDLEVLQRLFQGERLSEIQAVVTAILAEMDKDRVP